METNNQGPAGASGLPTPGEMLKSRVEALKQQAPAMGADMRSSVCKECGSPLSDTNQFCWMCGASRGSDADPRVDLGRNAGPRLVRPSPPMAGDQQTSDQQTSDQQASSFSTGDFVDGSLALAPTPQAGPRLEPAVESRVPVPKPEYMPMASAERAADPEFPFQFVVDRSKYETANKREFPYRAAAVLVLAVVIAALGYWQRNNFGTLFSAFKSMADREMSSWQGEDTAAKPGHQEAANAASEVRRRAHNAQSAASARELNSQPAVSIPVPDKLPLGVKVRGQHSDKGPVVKAADGVYNSGAVEVGISEPWIMDARLSPMAVEISPRESLALLIRRVPPVYPEAARRANIQGSVVLKVVIRKDGNVGDLRAVSGDPLLVPAAMDSVRQWVYKPYYRDGVPTDVETVVVVEFTLASQAASTNAGR